MSHFAPDGLAHMSIGSCDYLALDLVQQGSSMDIEVTSSFISPIGRFHYTGIWSVVDRSGNICGSDLTTSSVLLCAGASQMARDSHC